MSTSTVLYKNNLRTEATHTASGQIILTDAPIDNNGKGEAFSPTDLVATALASCMITIIAIAAEKNNIDVSKTSANVKKIMGVNPRTISDIVIDADSFVLTTFPNRTRSLIVVEKIKPLFRIIGIDHRRFDHAIR